MIRLKVQIGEETYTLGSPISASREVQFNPTPKSSGAFYLPPFQISTFEVKNIFVGDILRGGSCNVTIHNYSPHNLTHLETSLHIVDNGIPVSAIPNKHLNGILYLIDLTKTYDQDDECIKWDDISEQITNLHPSVTFIALKTYSSTLDQFHDFSGEDPLFLDPFAAKMIHDLKNNKINGLILDLPSIDKETDGGKLLAHRNFLGLPREGIKSTVEEFRFIVELAYFENLQQGYYYLNITPPKIDDNACITDIQLSKIKGLE
ncbi:MAG: cyclase family protein [Candidatus Heimdallarchaeota archaeon]|nr:cyclase family protein [Candidatus Heimdallarchaeota archaeon]MDH5647437.1 cyclase family protein [Candidatus Heimdallarchaeota archaeon]